jgi:hypothetical protein
VGAGRLKNKSFTKNLKKKEYIKLVVVIFNVRNATSIK